MSEAASVVQGVRVCASGGSATAIELLEGSGVEIIVPSSVFFPSLAATLDVTQMGPRAFVITRITSILIPRHVQILCSFCFSSCNSLSSISFETESELGQIEADTFYSTSLSSVLVPQNTRFIAGGAFPCKCVVRYGRCRCRIQ
jgi:hypothetical protein